MRLIPDMLNPVIALSQIQEFLEQGGIILAVIMIATFLLWMLIIERYWYFLTTHQQVVGQVLVKWNQRSDKHSWYALQIRRKLISQLCIKTEHNLSTIQSVVAVAPLLGLLGTVTGMVEVFDVMAFTSSSNARGMAAGISKATIPTMAGMIVSLSGLFFISAFQRRAKYEVRAITDKMLVGVE